MLTFMICEQKSIHLLPSPSQNQTPWALVMWMGWTVPWTDHGKSV